MHPDVQIQLNTNDLLALADLSDLIAEGKKTEAKPGLYGLAAKYPHNIEIQNLIRVSLNPELSSKPLASLPYQQTSQFAPYPTQPQPNVTGKRPNGFSFLLSYVGYFMVCIIPLIALSVILNSTTQSSTSAINNCKTLSCMKAYSPLIQTQMTQMLISALMIFILTVISTMWIIIDSILITLKYKKSAIGIIALVSIVVSFLILGVWVFSFPLYLTYRRRVLSSYKPNGLLIAGQTTRKPQSQGNQL